MPELRRLGHVGIYCEDYQKMKDFYTRVLGLKVTDEHVDRQMCFLTSSPDWEHHELALFAARGATQPTQFLQQVSFKVDSVDEVREFYHRLQKEQVRIESTVTHGFSCSVYFYDPEDNRVEIYYSTGFHVSPPINEKIDLDRPTEELLAFAQSFEKRPAQAVSRS